MITGYGQLHEPEIALDGISTSATWQMPAGARIKERYAMDIVALANGGSWWASGCDNGQPQTKKITRDGTIIVDSW